MGRWKDASRKVDAACRSAGRDRPLAREIQVFVQDLPLARARDFLSRLEDAGADAAIVVLVEERGAEAVRRLAKAVL